MTSRKTTTDSQISQKIAKNSIFSAIRFILVTFVIFIITPYVLHKLGSMKFGIWALTGVLTTYARLGDFGMARALVKFVAEFDAKKDTNTINETVNTAMGLYIFFAGVGCLIFLLLREAIVVNLFHIPVELREEALFVFTGTILISAIDLISSTFDSVLNGLQRMDLTNTVFAFARVSSAIGAFIVLQNGYGLKGLTIKNGIIVLLVAASNFCLTRRVFPNLKLGLSFLRLQRAREILRFSANIQIVNFVVLCIEPLNKTLLSHFLSLGFVTYYEVASRILSQIISFFQALAIPIYPAVSEIEVTRGKDAVSNLYFRSMRYLTLLSLPIFTGVIILAPYLIQLWLGTGYEVSALTLQMLASAWFVSMLATPAYLIAQGIGFPHLSMYSSVVTGALSLFLSVPLLSMIGYYGIIIGNSTSIIVGSVLMLFLFRYVLRGSLERMIQAIFTRALFINLILAVSMYFATRQIKPLNFLTLMVFVICYVVFYVVAIVAIGYLDTDDKQLISQLLPARVISSVCKDRSEVS